MSENRERHELRIVTGLVVKVVAVGASKLGPAHHLFYDEQGRPLRWRSVRAQGGRLFVEEMDWPGVERDIGPGTLVDYGTFTPVDQ